MSGSRHARGPCEAVDSEHLVAPVLTVAVGVEPVWLAASVVAALPLRLDAATGAGVARPAASLEFGAR